MLFVFHHLFLVDGEEIVAQMKAGEVEEAKEEEQQPLRPLNVQEGVKVRRTILAIKGWMISKFSASCQDHF